MLRIVIPVLLLIGGIGVAYAVMKNTTTPPTPTATSSAGASSPTTPATSPTPSDAAATPVATGAATAAPTPASGADGTNSAQTPAAAPIGAPAGKTYTARAFPFAGYTPIGSLDPADKGGQFQMRMEFSAIGAGLHDLSLANHFTTIDRTTHESLQQLLNTPTDKNIGLTAFGADKVEINGIEVGLWMVKNSLSETLWRETAPGAFEAVIFDEAGKDVARITRRFVLASSSYEFLLEQRFENLTDAPMTIVWHQYGPADQPMGTIRYGGDTRRGRFGYLPPQRLDPSRTVQGGDRYMLAHADLLGTPRPDAFFPGTTFPVWDAKALWPNPRSIKEEDALAWAATTSRYFAVAVHPAQVAAVPRPGVAVPGTPFTLAAEIGRFALPTDIYNTAKYASSDRAPKGYVALTIRTAPINVAAGQSADLSMGAYAGPISRKYVEREPRAWAAGLETLVLFTFGGPCGFCTFQPIALFLSWFLAVLHSYVVFDWALAIMLLVVCVRTILHPVTRWSQTNLTRFGKQMAAVAPKQKALQEKYKNDPAKMREELGRLMREENVNYFGALGCLPAFLQTPVWIALYAMIYFTFELRHEAAFFGVIQNVTGGRWGFLGDLAEPDNFINFHKAFGSASGGFWVPMLSSLMGPIEGLNILPLVLGVVFYIQQKYMSPPTSGTLTPEQEQQQKIMKVMTVVMFPLFMYNAPAGLSLYFMTNSTLAIIESKWIRSHVDKVDALRASMPKPVRGPGKEPAKKPGFLARLQQEVEKRQKDMEKKGKGKK